MNYKDKPSEKIPNYSDKPRERVTRINLVKMLLIPNF
jgi:hypothetical protein